MSDTKVCGRAFCYQCTQYTLPASECKVLEGMQKTGPADLDTLTPVVYDDVPDYLHPIARYSLLAHLGKLLKDGRVCEDNGAWRRT